MTVRLGHEGTGAVTADVVERGERTVVLNDDDDSPPRELMCCVVTRRAQLRPEGRELPLAREDPTPLRGVLLGIAVRAGGERVGHTARVRASGSAALK